jgi:hypothetical protein
MPLIWVNREAEYFCAKGWTAPHANDDLICSSGNQRTLTIVKPTISLRTLEAEIVHPEGTEHRAGLPQLLFFAAGT